MSPYTLKLSDSKVQQEFVSYLRLESMINAKYTVRVMAGISVIITALYIYKKVMTDKATDRLLLFVITIDTPTFALIMVYLLSKYKIVWANLLGPILFCSYTLAIFFVILMNIGTQN